MSQAQLMRRCTITNPEILERFCQQKRDIIAVLGHFNNWEWLIIVSAYTNYKFTSIYKPLQNKYLDRFLNNLRGQFGTVLIPMSFILREIINDRKDNILTFSAFIADQTPIKNDIKYWTTFLNQDTPVYLGAEKIASRYDMAIIFLNLQKVRRGYYNVDVEVLFEHTAGLPEYLITETHVKRLEEIIRKKPEFWIWSHRRWKHKRPVKND
jgi:KDO2-lipid IV(A) lauroyltransferase